MSILEQQIYRVHTAGGLAKTFLVFSLTTAITLVALSLSMGPVSGLTTKTDPLAQAKANVAKAKKDADQAASRYSNAYSALQEISDQLVDTQAQLTSAESSISGLQTKASTQAKDAYIRSSDSTVNKTYESIVDESRREQFLSTVTEFDDAQLTMLVSMQEDLRITRDELASLKEDRKTALDNLASEKKALETKLADATKAQQDLETRLAKEAKAKAAAANRAKKKSSTAVGTIINPGNGPLTCPIQGSTAFTNDWGNARSGGRSHKGTDIFSARGTPNVAVVSGTVMFQNERTGGISAYVTGGGYTYYYTHLQDTVGGSRAVQRGEVIGHTGNTGNAAGGSTHTHFEIRSGGPNGSRVNPYPTLRSIC